MGAVCAYAWGDLWGGFAECSGGSGRVGLWLYGDWESFASHDSLARGASVFDDDVGDWILGGLAGAGGEGEWHFWEWSGAIVVRHGDCAPTNERLEGLL
jgi:hypothetical protein